MPTAALACTVRYFHSGVFVPIKEFYCSLELVKLALELGSQPLVDASIQAVVTQLRHETAGTVLQVCLSLSLCLRLKGLFLSLYWWCLVTYGVVH